MAVGSWRSPRRLRQTNHSEQFGDDLPVFLLIGKEALVLGKLQLDVRKPSNALHACHVRLEHGLIFLDVGSKEVDSCHQDFR